MLYHLGLVLLPTTQKGQRSQIENKTVVNPVLRYKEMQFMKRYNLPYNQQTQNV